MPLEEFPLDEQERINALADALKRPPKWLDVGGNPPLAQIRSRAWYEWHIRRGIDPDRPKDRRRERVRSAIRDLVIARDGLICGLCGGAVERHDIHIDHILPVSRGGGRELTNLQVAHSLCNMRKGAGV